MIRSRLDLHESRALHSDRTVTAVAPRRCDFPKTSDRPCTHTRQTLRSARWCMACSLDCILGSASMPDSQDQGSDEDRNMPRVRLQLAGLGTGPFQNTGSCCCCSSSWVSSWPILDHQTVWMSMTVVSSRWGMTAVVCCSTSMLVMVMRCFVACSASLESALTIPCLPVLDPSSRGS